LARDEVRRNFNGTNYALSTELGGAGDHIVPLDEDEHAESTAITSYPLGISIMSVSATASWDGIGEAATVTTERTSAGGRQVLIYGSGGEQIRWWESTAWGSWRSFSDSLHQHFNLPSWDDDSHTESASITDYPDGISIMGVTEAAAWDAGVDSTVTTFRNGSIGYQLLKGTGDNYIATRYFESGAWSAWSDLELSPHSHQELVAMTTDAHAESVAVTSYPNGLSSMATTAGANWGPNTGEAGHVVTEHYGSTGRQTFVVPSTGISYSRYYTSGAWGSWSASGAGWSAVDASTSVKGISTLSVAPVSPTSPIAVGDNDTRMSNQRVPTDSSVTNAKVDAAAAIAESKLNLASDAAAGTASRRTLGTGATQAAAGNDSRLSDARAPTTREWMATFFYGGNLAVQVGVGGEPVPNSGTPTITEVSVYVNTKPTSQNVIVDLNSVNLSTGAKTTLYTTQGKRPQITPGGNYRINATLPDIVAPGVGSVLTADIDQVGSGTVGANLTVKVRGTY
jgi:hypothetical protein